MTASPSAPSTHPAISVIVPIFNVEEYLQECLDSIADQTAFASCEVILVDDGSTDASPRIAADFAATRPNVRLVQQTNAGPGVARNRGLSEAVGEFIVFVDSDDVLPSDALSHLHSRMAADVDVAVGRMETFPAATRWPWLKELEQGTNRIDSLADAPALVHGAGPCNKMFRRTFVDGASLRFEESGHFEDIRFVVSALALAEGIALTNRLVYRYRKRLGGGSIMDAVFTRTENFWDHLRAEEFLSDLSTSLKPETVRVIQLFMVRSFQGFLLRAPGALEGSELRELYDRSRAVFSTIPSDVVLEAALDLRHRLAFVALYLDDYDLFVNRAAATRALESRDGQLRLAYEAPAPLNELLQLESAQTRLESVALDARRRNLVLTGRFVLRGVDLSESLPFPLRLRLRGAGRTVDAEQVPRPELAARQPEALHSGFRATVPLRDLRSRDFEPRLVFETPTGQASTRLLVSPGYYRSARELVAGRLRLIPRVNDAGSAVVAVGRVRNARERARWRRRLVREDLGHALRLRPLWRPRLLRLVTKPFFRGRDIWLVGERHDTAQDNGYALFRHLRSTEPDREAFYVTDRPDLEPLRGLGNVVRRGSFRHRLLMGHARLLVGAYDLDSYLLPPQWTKADYHRHLAWRIGSRRAFLQHGVIYNDVSAALHRGVTGLDLFVTSSNTERDFIRSQMGYDREVVVTGLPRFDALLETPPRANRRVLFMPTWRAHLVAPSYQKDREVAAVFERSDYYRFVTGFLRSQRLHQLLQDLDLTLEFYPHYEIAELASTLAPQHPRIVVATRERAVKDALVDCSLFITDWSSVFFDAALRGLPVITAPFDEEDFRERHYRQGYFDLFHDGFGPTVRSAEDLVTRLSIYARNGFTREEQYNRRASAFFGPGGSKACGRVVTELVKVAEQR